MWHSGGPSTTGRLCHHWHRTGTCSYGDRCRFIHTHTTALDTTHGGGGPGVPASSAGAAGTPPHPFGGGTPHAQHFYHQGQGRPRHDGSTSSTPSYHQHPQQHGAPGGGAGGGAQRGYYSSTSYSGRSSSYQQQRAPYSSRPTSAYSYSSQTWGGGGGGGHSLGEDLAPPFTQREWVAPQVRARRQQALCGARLPGELETLWQPGTCPHAGWHAVAARVLVCRVWPRARRARRWSCAS